MNRSASQTKDRPNEGRRSFMWKAGAAVSAVLAASVPAMSMPNSGKDDSLNNEVDRLSAKLKTLEDETKIRELHRSFESLLDRGRYEDLVDLFSADGQATWNGGIFKGKERGVRRFFCDCFRAGKTGKKVAPAPGFEFDSEQLHEKIEIYGEHQTATARFPYSMQVGTPLLSDSVLVQMARLQGGGIMKWWEGGSCLVSFIKEVEGNSWKIKSIDFQALARAEYAPGRSYAKPVDRPLFSKVYPDDPSGPDQLSKPVKRSKTT